MRTGTGFGTFDFDDDFPQMPASLVRLERVLDAPEQLEPEIDAVVSECPDLESQLLDAVAATRYGRSGRTDSIAQAARVLGARVVRNLLLAMFIGQVRQQLTEGTPLEGCEPWRYSLAVAEASRIVAASTDYVDGEDAFFAGLLHDIGKSILARRDPPLYADVLSRAALGEHALAQLERRAFGTDHRALGARLCRHWKLPDVVVSAAVDRMDGIDRDSRQPLARVVYLAEAATRFAGIGESGDPSVDPDRIVRELSPGLSLGNLVDLVHCLPNHMNRVERMMKLSPRSCPPSAPGYTACVDLADPGERAIVELAIAGLGWLSSGTGDVVIGDTPGAAVRFEDWRSGVRPSGMSACHVAAFRNWMAEELAGVT